MRYGRRPLVGIGGWLAILIGTLGLNAVIAAIVSIGFLLKNPFPPALRVFGSTVMVIDLMRAGGYGFIAWRLFARQQPSTVRIAVVGLWCLALALPVGQLLAERVFLGTFTIGAVSDVSMLRGFGYAAIWTAYLLRSDRVANTYAPPADRLADVFG